MKDGKRCREGYHLLDTVSAPDSTPETRTVGSDEQTRSSESVSNESVKDFLSSLIRDEVSRAMKDMYPKTPPVTSPAVTLVESTMTQLVTQAPQKEQTGQDYLWALLGKKLLSSA